MTGKAMLICNFCFDKLPFFKKRHDVVNVCVLELLRGGRQYPCATCKNVEEVNSNEVKWQI